MLCASDAADMLAKIKTGEAAARRDLRLRLTIERLTGQPQDEVFANGAMAWGTEHEGEARLAYESLTGNLVHEVGFLAHDTLLAGCSPDGEMGGFKTLLEIKAPKSATHLGYVRGRKIPSVYLPQLTHQLWITSADAVEFFSYDPRMPTGLQTFWVTLTRGDVDIAAYELAARLFLDEVARDVLEVQALADGGHV
jgi:hypothetical protein